MSPPPLPLVTTPWLLVTDPSISVMPASSRSCTVTAYADDVLAPVCVTVTLYVITSPASADAGPDVFTTLSAGSTTENVLPTSLLLPLSQSIVAVVPPTFTPSTFAATSAAIINTDSSISSPPFNALLSYAFDTAPKLNVTLSASPSPSVSTGVPTLPTPRDGSVSDPPTPLTFALSSSSLPTSPVGTATVTVRSPGDVPSANVAVTVVVTTSPIASSVPVVDVRPVLNDDVIVGDAIVTPASVASVV